ncbi:hypothetical protein PoB_001339900 [Plakobranchus ocellatus]|uniref:Uncharacterized protein n=1 Tax=Plakobranchus ocellatus TaxID=259542 RepID=A0AAV3YUZ7_9GAST|nr:hypothetical protein PoB_001339900 [Plakobranchus ocellatus]
MHSHCSKTHTLPDANHPLGACAHTRRSFVLLENIDRSYDVSTELKTLGGMCKLHAICRVGDRPQERNLACFCGACEQQDFAQCAHERFVHLWEFVEWQIPGYQSAKSCQNKEVLDSHDIEAFFKTLLKMSSACATFQELRQLAESVERKIPLAAFLKSKYS